MDLRRRRQRRQPALQRPGVSCRRPRTRSSWTTQQLRAVRLLYRVAARPSGRARWRRRTATRAAPRGRRAWTWRSTRASRRSAARRSTSRSRSSTCSTSLNNSWGQLRGTAFNNLNLYNFSRYIDDGDVGNRVAGRVVTNDDIGKPVVSFDERTVRDAITGDALQHLRLRARAGSSASASATSSSAPAPSAPLSDSDRLSPWISLLLAALLGSRLAAATPSSPAVTGPVV